MVSGTTTNFLYDQGNVTEEMQGTTVTADYGADAQNLNGTKYWMLQDGHTSTRQLLNSSQAIVSSYTTDASGNNISSSGTAANPFKWNGGYYADAAFRISAQSWMPSADAVRCTGNGLREHLAPAVCRPSATGPSLTLPLILLIAAIAALVASKQQ